MAKDFFDTTIASLQEKPENTRSKVRSGSRNSYKPLSAFEAISIKIASPEKILEWSHGEVQNAETVDYRSGDPKKGGLFCEDIFGKVNGNNSKGKNLANRLEETKARREHMGHISLAVPVVHYCLFRCSPSRLATMLDISTKTLQKIIYYNCYVVTECYDTPFKVGEVFDETKYAENREAFGDSFKVDKGAPALLKLLQGIDLKKLKIELELKLGKTLSAEENEYWDATAVTEEEIALGQQQGNPVAKASAQRKKLTQRLRLVEGFINSNMKPEWMVMTVLPVIPPDLRPLVALEGGRWASSDLNDLYRHIIHRNTRLKTLIDARAPSVLLDNECRMVQEAVDALLDNNGGESKRPSTNTSGRQLKSLSDALKGKQGRFRQNLLGKRVDYSGRSVIVVGPELKINQCGLPKTMALTLFEPYIIRHLKSNAICSTINASRKAIKECVNDETSPVWDILEHVVTGHPVMLNRAPTLHRLSIQAFDPILIEGSAIRLHPLVCTGFNADFDGDQMAVHVPLSPAAQLECKLLMLSSLNIFSPASGNPIATPTQDIALGVYYLTIPPKEDDIRSAKTKIRIFQNVKEVLFALESGYLKMHDAVLLPNPDYQAKDPEIVAKGLKVRPRGNTTEKVIVTTPGRCIFNNIWDPCLGFWNEMPKYDAVKDTAEGGVVKKKEMGKLIAENYKYVGHMPTIELLDRLKNLGYEYATVAGYSISIADMKVPPEKKALIEAARSNVENIAKQNKEGALTNTERHNMVQDAWTKTSNDVAEALFKLFEREHRKHINSLYSMLDSGARGSKDQIRQLAGMRGLMAKPNGEVIERPVLANFREGLSVLEYFISSHGARKGLADTALKTANSGYMTRKLVDVAQDIICRCDDCGTHRGIPIQEIPGQEKPLMTLKDRLVGRYSAEDIYDPTRKGIGKDERIIIHAGEEFTPAIVDDMQKCGINKAIIRSVLTCEVEHGVCKKCYGKNLASDRDAEVGDSIGIVAAQSIGEPGTQLTMRTFHIGGTASSKQKEPKIKATHEGRLFFDNVRIVESDENAIEEKEKSEGEEKPVKKGKGAKKNVVVNTNGTIIVYDEERAKNLAEENRAIAKAEAEIMGAAYNENYPFETEAIHKCAVETFIPESGTVLRKKDGDRVKVDDIIGEWDPYKVPVIAEVAGVVEYSDLYPGLTLNIKKSGNTEQREVTKHREDVHPSILIHDKNDPDPNHNIGVYPLEAGAILSVTDKQVVKPGTVLARFPRQEQKTQDITGGLPRVSELFEAHLPKDSAVIAQMDGFIVEGKTVHGKKQYFISEDPNRIEYTKDEIAKDPTLKNKKIEYVEILIPPSKHMIVSKGDRVEKGQKLTFGSIKLPDLLKACGEQELQRHLVNEVQTVYRTQGVEISDKHIEIIVRQMLQKRRIINPGDTRYLEDEEVDRYDLERENKRVQEAGGTMATYEPVLQGIAKASLTTESFISAASFQDTTRILTDAATLGKVDTLRGFKENVITGHLIPAGTGSVCFADLHPQTQGSAVMPGWRELRKNRNQEQAGEFDYGRDETPATPEEEEELTGENGFTTFDQDGNDISHLDGDASQYVEDDATEMLDSVSSDDFDDSEAYGADEDGNV